MAYLGWRTYTSAEASVCYACNRPLHAVTKTVAELDGKRELFCCPACALTAARQRGDKLKFVELTDYVSHGPLDPAKAFLVRGSNVNPCTQHEAEHMLDQDMQPVPLQFDRCAPSILAFADAQLAEEFATTHGGVLTRVSDLLAQQ